MYNQKYVMKGKTLVTVGDTAWRHVMWVDTAWRHVLWVDTALRRVCVRERERGEAAHAQQLLSLTADPVQHSRFQTHRSAVFSIALPHPDIYTGGNTLLKNKPSNMSVGNDFGNPLRKFKLVFLGEQSGECHIGIS